jgi:hypothetical protein
MKQSASIALGIFLFASGGSLRAQQVNPRTPPPPPPPPPADSTSAPAGSATPSASAQHPIDLTVPPPPPPADDPAEATTAPSGPVFDPLHAQRSIDIGTFYLRKGVYDAAIDRFIEASNYQPSLSAPWKLLGEAYEKKREYSKAAESYKKYLEILPRAPDAAKIRKLVSELEEKSTQESHKR